MMEDKILHISRKTFDTLARGLSNAGLTIARGVQQKNFNAVNDGLAKLKEVVELVEGIETGSKR